MTCLSTGFQAVASRNWVGLKWGMHLLSVGQPFVGVERKMDEGVQFSLSGSSAELHLILPKLTEAEIKAIRTAKAEFGIFEHSGVLFFLYRFGRIFPWSDTPYSVHDEEKLRPVNLVLLKEPSRALLTVILVSAENALIRVLRAISLSSEVTRELWMRVEIQRSSTFPMD